MQAERVDALLLSFTRTEYASLMLPNIEDTSPWPLRQRFLFVQRQMYFPLIHSSRSLSLDHSCV